MKMSKRLNLSSVALAGFLCVSAAQGAVAAEAPTFHTQATELSQNGLGSLVDYVYQGRHYPYSYGGHYYNYRYGGHYYNYRYGGRYYNYSYGGKYYNHRSYSNGQWRYY
jgi:hypothetical protein